MGEKHPRQTREERLAARLRENLKRRKEQARAMARPHDDPAPSPDQPDDAPAPGDASPHLSGPAASSRQDDALPKPREER